LSGLDRFREADSRREQIHNAASMRYTAAQGQTHKSLFGFLVADTIGGLMAGDAGQNFTQMLSLASEGNESAAAKLLPLVYDELRQLARSYFRRGGQAHTLQPTALVHEAFVKLVGAEVAAGARGGIEGGEKDAEHSSGTAGLPAGGWKDRAHFFAVAATAMRQILIDHARAKHADKRGGQWQRISFTHADARLTPDSDVSALELHDALERLAKKDQRKAQVVEMRVFGGLTCEEIGQVLSVSYRTVENDWYSARAWLERELEDHHESRT
jgi:RNA polymerase sigma-70 factor, ECF subfamily